MRLTQFLKRCVSAAVVELHRGGSARSLRSRLVSEWLLRGWDVAAGRLVLQPHIIQVELSPGAQENATDKASPCQMSKKVKVKKKVGLLKFSKVFDNKQLKTSMSKVQSRCTLLH